MIVRRQLSESLGGALHAKLLQSFDAFVSKTANLDWNKAEIFVSLVKDVNLSDKTGIVLNGLAK